MNPPRNLNIKIYKITVLPVVFYGYGTWSVTIREEHRLRVEGVSELGVEEFIWTYEEGRNSMMEKIT
jgi:hypothetical protein